MPLLDHFHPPLSSLRHWEGLHGQWAGSIASALNRDLLPPGYFAEPQIHVGSRVEIDVATFQGDSLREAQSGATTATATRAPKVWIPPVADLSLPAVFPDSLEVLVFNTEAGPTLVAAVEMVSPGNKDRPESRQAFLSKCASYLQQGIGLIVVDIVTSRHANLHNELVRLLGTGNEPLLPTPGLYAVAYRAVRRAKEDRIEGWTAVLQVGHELPELPLALDKGICVPLNLETTYLEACQRNRLP